MKNTTKIISSVAIVVVIIVTVLLFSNSKLFQGYLTSKKITIVDRPLMLVLFSEDTGYQIQISDDKSSVEAAIRLNKCRTSGTGEKQCEFEFFDKNNNDQIVNLVKDKDTFTMYGNGGYNYKIKVVDVTDFPEGSDQSERSVIELSKIKAT